MAVNKPVTLFLAAAAVAVPLLVHDSRPRVTLDFFSVGQGDAVLVSSGRSQLLIDAGPDRTVLSRLGRAMPFFDRTIEQVVITHPHADHYLGLAAVLERYRVRQVLLPSARADPPDLARLLDKARVSGAEIVEVAAGDRIRLGGAELAALWPPRSADPPSGAAEGTAVNALSLVMRLTVFCGGAGERPASDPGCGAALLAGDADTGTEDGILDGAAPLAARVLKVAHHGSNRSTGAGWLAAVRPELAVIEVGRNSYGHPAVALLRRLRTAGARVWRTDRDGDLRVVFIKNSGPGRSEPFVWRAP